MINYDLVLPDATIASDQIEKIYGTDATLDTPTKTGYDFSAWYRNYNLATKTYSNEYTGDDSLYVDGQATGYTIYAKWRAHVYNIKYNVNGVGTAPADTVKTYDTSTSLSYPTNVPAGYIFDGWYSSTDLVDANRYDGNTDLTTSDGVDVNVYARWKVRITYNANGHGTAPAAVDIVLNSNITLPSLAEVSGYEHDSVNSWYDGSNINEAICIGQAGTNYTVTTPKVM